MNQPVLVTASALIGCVDTWRGNRVDLADPSVDSICLDDIAWSLAAQPRFNGHTLGELPYSIAQHSIWVAWFLETQMKQGPEMVRQALFHDAHEAYIGDICTPLKNMPGVSLAITPIANRLQDAIHTALSIPPPNSIAKFLIKRADTDALVLEADRLIVGGGRDWGFATVTPRDRLLWHAPIPADHAFEKFWVCNEVLAAGESIAEIFE